MTIGKGGVMLHKKTVVMGVLFLLMISFPQGSIASSSGSDENIHDPVDACETSIEEVDTRADPSIARLRDGEEDIDLKDVSIGRYPFTVDTSDQSTLDGLDRVLSQTAGGEKFRVINFVTKILPPLQKDTMLAKYDDMVDYLANESENGYGSFLSYPTLAPRFDPEDGLTPVVEDRLSDGTVIQNRYNKAPNYAIIDVTDQAQRDRFQQYVREICSHLHNNTNVVGFNLAWGMLGEAGHTNNNATGVYYTAMSGYSVNSLNKFKTWLADRGLPGGDTIDVNVQATWPVPSPTSQSDLYMNFIRFQQEQIMEFNYEAIAAAKSVTDKPMSLFSYRYWGLSQYARCWSPTPNADHVHSVFGEGSEDYSREISDTGLHGGISVLTTFQPQPWLYDVFLKRDMARGISHWAMLFENYYSEGNTYYNPELFPGLSRTVISRYDGMGETVVPRDTKAAVVVPSWSCAAIPANDATNLYMPKYRSDIPPIYNRLESLGINYDLIIEEDLQNPVLQTTASTYDAVILPYADYVQNAFWSQEWTNLTSALGSKLYQINTESVPDLATFEQAMSDRGEGSHLDLGLNGDGKCQVGMFNNILYNVEQEVNTVTVSGILDQDRTYVIPPWEAFPVIDDDLVEAEDVSNVTRSAGWYTHDNAGFSGGTSLASNTPGDTMSFTFNGTSIAMVVGLGENRGIAQVSVDGVSYRDFDLYVPGYTPMGELFIRGGLDPGDHTVVVTVSGQKNDSATDVYLVIDAFRVGHIFNNDPPQIPGAPSGASSGLIGIAYEYTASSTDPDGDSLRYIFDWDDGTFSSTDLKNSGTAGSLSHAWNQAGTYQVKVKAEDEYWSGSGWSSAHSVTISDQPANDPPAKPSTPTGPSSGDTGMSYSYSTSTTDPNGDQVKYGWDWDGNGVVDEWSSLVNSGTGDTRGHSWPSAGTYNVKVKAEDDQGLNSTWSDPLAVTISEPQLPQNHPPADPSAPSGPTSVLVDDVHTYSAVTTDPDGDSLIFEFRWDDGTADSETGPVASGTDGTADHAWSSAGSYNVSVRARDGSSAYSNWSDPLTVVVSAEPVEDNNSAPLTPDVPSGPDTGQVGVNYMFSTSAGDPDGDPLTLTFDWDDGTTTTTGSMASGSLGSAIHSWSAPGTYQVTVKASDDGGKASPGSGAHSITIVDQGGGGTTNSPPGIPQISGPSEAETNTVVLFELLSTDPDGDDVSFVVDWGDGTGDHFTDWTPSGTPLTVGHLWSEPGSYSIRAQALDISQTPSEWSDPHPLVVTDPGGGGSQKNVDDCQVSDLTAPGEVTAGDGFSITVTFKNTGTTMWSHPMYSMVATGADVLGDSEYFLTPGETVLPGGTRTFTLDLSAPTVAGTITLGWSMARSGIPFGEALPVTLDVVLADVPDDIVTLPVPDVPDVTGSDVKAGEESGFTMDVDLSGVSDLTDLELEVDWGDGSTSTYPMDGDGPVTVMHTWDDPGSYTVKARVVSSIHGESDWSDGWTVEVSPAGAGDDGVGDDDGDDMDDDDGSGDDDDGTGDDDGGDDDEGDGSGSSSDDGGKTGGWIIWVVVAAVCCVAAVAGILIWVRHSSKRRREEALGEFEGPEADEEERPEV